MSSEDEEDEDESVGVCLCGLCDHHLVLPPSLWMRHMQTVHFWPGSSRDDHNARKVFTDDQEAGKKFLRTFY
ncbi:hypothetical protein BV898_03188 [Hypsibius exemplaris]|uniref:Uncharacterized protein n=1 Tax=Hypsibius exemplaris TaxID=2072580 RepID=A0A1W0X5E1_HYPEX|nr:hypothetical protein BV898_03188 [Hypsibius exemplaris]